MIGNVGQVRPGPCCCVCDRLGGDIGDGECWAGLGGVRWGAGVFGEVWRCFGPDGSIFVDRFHAGRVGGLVGEVARGLEPLIPCPSL